MNKAVEVAAVKVDAEAYRRHALDTLKTMGELLPGCVHQGERELFSVRFGKDSAAKEGDEASPRPANLPDQGRHVDNAR